jgi:type I restriction enzyme, S subunit
MHHPEIEMALPDSWFWTSIEDIASTKHYAMSSGPFGSSLGKKDYRNSGIPVIRGQNIQERSFVLNNSVYITQDKAVELIRSSAYPNDIIVVAVGSSGQTAIVPDNLPWAILSQNCNKITLDKLFISPKYILYCLQNNIGKEQLHKKTTDTARPFLSLTNLKKTIVPIPPLEEQHEIVRRVAALFQLADAIEGKVVAGAQRAEKLTQAILAKAFRGELVPTEAELARRAGRDYEPAAVLLARLKEERRLITEAQPRRQTLKGRKRQKA